MPALDLKGCLDDSPKFRKRIAIHEDSIQQFELSLKTLTKLTRLQVDSSTEYSLRQQELATDFTSFAQSQDDPIIAHALEKFGKSMIEVEKCRTMFNSHVTETFISPLEKFVKETIFPIKELKKRFEKASDEVDSALGRYMSKKPKDPTIIETAKELADARKGFYQVYMEYVSRLNDIEAKKKVDYMENVLAYMYTKSAFHHQSYEILKDLEPYMRDLTGLLNDTRQRHNEERSESLEYQDFCAQSGVDTYNPLNTIISSAVSSPGITVPYHNTTENPNKSGYLFERKGGRVMQSWIRKYFSIEGEYLVCSMRSVKGSKDDDQSASYNLRVCSIKLSDSYDRRFCFELISPQRIIVLQAENENEMHEWVNSLRMVNQKAINSDKAPPPLPSLHRRGVSDVTPDIRLNGFAGPSGTVSDGDKELLNMVQDKPGNDKCADCLAKEPEWASTNLGVIVCIECSGIHRSLGVHVSKVRSVILDKWETESIEVMLELGNTIGNNIFEESVPSDMETFRIKPDSSPVERDLWITEKYVKRSFVAHKGDEAQETVNQGFWNAIANNDLAEALRYLARGANVDYRNPNEHLQTPLHRSVELGNEVAVEFLLQWSSNVNEVDEKGWTNLHYAANSNNVRLVLGLLKRHAKADIKDESGKTSLDLAVEHQNVQAVTALRLFAFDKQHNSSPANSLDFGFREAMSSFKQNSSFERGHGASHSALDLRQTKSHSPKESSSLHETGSKLLRSDSSQ
ncbi:hypothetical protein CLU79DRAFT_768786 [Phycomyces nitens]|nr:hypothetical protein CLU79DRAFT_768786 [Phycomyces nitens]